MSMRAGMPSFLQLLRDKPPPASTTESEWLGVLTIAEEENLLPWISARLSTIAAQLPDSVRCSVAEIRRECQQKAFAWSAALKHMLAAFSRREIRAIWLKGPWLAERLYGDTALRSYGDLDFLVRPSDWSAAEDLLRELGFTPLRPADNRHRHWKHAEIHVEAHFQLGNPPEFCFDIESVWGRAYLSDFQGIPGWLLAPSDELLFLCVHAVLHCFERLNLLLDLRLAFRRFPLPDLTSYGESGAEFKNALAFCWMLAKRVEDNSSLPVLPAPWLLDGLRLEAESLWQRRILHPPPSYGSISKRRFYLAIKSPRFPRFFRLVRYAQSLFDLLIRQDFVNYRDRDFAARLHLRRTWQIRLLRPFRLLINATRRRVQRRTALSRTAEHVRTHAE